MGGPTVIVTYARYRIAMSVIKSLSAAGAQVIAGDSISWPLGRFSRHITGYFQYSDPFENPDAFIEDLIKQAKKTGATFLVPSFTETPIIARYKDRLAKAGLHCLLAPASAIDFANDKAKVTALAAELGVAVPETWYPQSLSDVSEIAPDLPYPVIVKSPGGKAGEGQIIVENAHDLSDAFQKVSKGRSAAAPYPFVQRLIKGKDVGAALLYDNGTPVAANSFEILRTYKRVHSVLRKSTYLPAAITAAETLLSHLKWHGIAQLDFIQDEKTGQLYVLEINPRFWGSVQNSIEAGVDLPRLLLAVHQGQSIPQRPVQNPDIRSIWLAPYMLSALTALAKGRWAEFWAHRFNPFSRTLRYDDVSITDPVATLADPILGLINLGRTGGLAMDGQRRSAPLVKE